MDDAGLVRMRQTRADLFDQLHLPQHGQGRTQPQHVGKGFAADVLHRDEGQALVLTDVEDRDDIGVAETSGGGRLAREAVPKLRSVEFRSELFDGHVPADARVAGAIESAHPAPTDQVNDLVPPEGPWNLHSSASAGDSQRCAPGSPAVSPSFEKGI